MRIFLLIIFLLSQVVLANEQLALKSADKPLIEKELEKIKYKTFIMHESGFQEDNLKGYYKNYYDFTMKLKSLIFFRKGIFVDFEENTINTLKNISCDSGLNIDGGYAKYVMDEYGNIFINNETHQIKHSYFLSGKAVADAGWIRIENGKLKLIVHDSGHYRPMIFQNLQFIIEMMSRGVKRLNIIMFYNTFLGEKLIRIDENNFYSIKKIYHAA